MGEIAPEEQFLPLSTIFYYLMLDFYVKGRFLEFRRYHNFANLFSKLSESILYKKRNKQVSVKSKELKGLDQPFCEGFPNSAAHTS